MLILKRVKYIKGNMIVYTIKQYKFLGIWTEIASSNDEKQIDELFEEYTLSTDVIVA